MAGEPHGGSTRGAAVCQLIGVEFYDPVTMAAAPAVLIAVAVLACRVPARRAMQVEPAAALRRE